MPSSCSRCSRCSRCGHRKSSSSSCSSRTDLSLSDNSTLDCSVVRRNQSTLLGVDADFLKSPRKHGKIFNVEFARNYNGGDGFEICVVKWLRSKYRCHLQGHFKQVIRMSIIAAQIVESFLEDVDTRGWKIEVNVPTLWRSELVEGKQRSVLVEPLIRDFRKFNSNSGWVGEGERTFSKVVQALSHYSYAWSGGKFILCDLQGGIMGKKCDTIVLSDPAITSLKKGTYGITDNGKDYLRNFFKHHKCSGMCSRFPKPKDNKVFFRPVMSTVTTGDC